MQGLRQLADVLNVETARLSGDPQRLQLALGESQSRKLQEADNLINAEIDKLNLPQSQKNLLKLLTPQQKYQAIYGEEKGKQSIERFGIYDSVTKKLEGTVLKDDFKGIEAVENQGKIVGQLRSPSLNQNPNVEIYELQNADGSFNRNITENEWLNLKAKDELPKGSKLVKLAVGAKAAETINPEDVSKQFSKYQTRQDATSQLINNLQDTAELLYKEPTAALATTGGLVLFVDSVIKNIDATGKIISKAENNPIYTGMKDGIYKSVEGKDFSQRISDISESTGVAESKIRDLAYLFAAARGQEGRGLSDKDYDNALRIVSGGVGAENRVAVLEDVAGRLKRETDTYFQNRRNEYQFFMQDEDLTEQQKANYNKYIKEIDAISVNPIPTFVNPFMQGPPQQISSTDMTLEERLAKYQ